MTKSVVDYNLIYMHNITSNASLQTNYLLTNSVIQKADAILMSCCCNKMMICFIVINRLCVKILVD